MGKFDYWRKDFMFSKSRKKFSGIPTVVEPFELQTELKQTSSNKEIILDAEVTIPPDNKIENIVIHKNDNVKSEVSAFGKKWHLSEIN